MKTGKRTPRAKLNPTERIMHIAVKKQINHDQILSCLYEDNFSQHSSMITVSICFGISVFHQISGQRITAYQTV